MTCIFSVVYNEQTVICVYKFLLKLLRIEKDCGIFKCFCDRKMSWTWNPFGMRPACIWSNIYDTGHWVKVFKASPLSLSLSLSLKHFHQFNAKSLPNAHDIYGTGQLVKRFPTFSLRHFLQFTTWSLVRKIRFFALDICRLQLYFSF